MNIFGQNLSKADVLRRVGDLSQIGGATLSTRADGKAMGTREISVQTGSGLCFTVVADRCMDISSLSFAGIPLSFLCKAGMSHPSYYSSAAFGFNRSFFAGLLTTCGLRNVGNSCEVNGETLGQHGRIGNTPAEDVCITQDWVGDEVPIILSGKMRESQLFGENLELKRTIQTSLGSRHFTIHDTVTNHGFVPEGHMILYHCNFGYPLVDTKSYLAFGEHQVTARDEAAKAELSAYDRIDAPKDRYDEAVFFHELTPDADGYTHAGIFHPTLGQNGMGIVMRIQKEHLPYLNQWKNMLSGDYVMALEPANCYPIGYQATKEQNMLCTLAPQESISYELQFHIVTSKEEFQSFFS